MSKKPTGMHDDAEHDEHEARASFLKLLPRDVLQSMIESRSKALDGKWLDQMEQSGVFSMDNMFEDITMLDGSVRKRITGTNQHVPGGFPLLCSLGACLRSSSLCEFSVDPYTGHELKHNGRETLTVKVLNPSQEFKDVFARIVNGFLQESSWGPENPNLKVLARSLGKFHYKEVMDDHLAASGAVLVVIAAAIGDVKSIQGLTKRFEKLEDVVLPDPLIGGFNNSNSTSFNPIVSALEYNRADSLKAFLDAGWSIDKKCKQVRTNTNLLKSDVMEELIGSISSFGPVILPSLFEVTLDALKENKENYTQNLKSMALEIMKTTGGREAYIDVLEKRGDFIEYANDLAAIAWGCSNFYALPKIRNGFSWDATDVSADNIDTTIKKHPIYGFLTNLLDQGPSGNDDEEMMNAEVAAWLKDCATQGKGALLAHSSGHALPQLLAVTKNYGALVTCMDQGADLNQQDSRSKISVMDFAKEDEYLENLIRSHKGKQFAYGVLDEILKENSIQSGAQP